MATSTQLPQAAALAKTTLTPVKQELTAQPKYTIGQDSPEVSTADSDTIRSPSIAFVPEACLFCTQLSSDFDTNLVHMQKSHGLFIPASIDDDALYIAVDKETLVGYMHLVIFGYHECLFCGTQRAGGWAARQHMIGRGHCKIDLAGAESEWRDFYESNDNLEAYFEDEKQDEDAVREEATLSSCGHHLSQVREKGKMASLCDGESLRLASGKVVAHRAGPAPKNPYRKPLTGDSTKNSQRGIDQMLLEASSPTQKHASMTGSVDTDAAADDLNTNATTQATTPASLSDLQALSRADRRLLASGKSAVTSAVATMSHRDRAALMHLSLAARRALVVGQFKQQERVQTAERKYWSRMESKGNSVMMKHFKNDVPGPKLG
ncbi:hypothetical protein N0V93_009988 [Gnomoniopsis smithogilvyi]|uniref:ZN622/Rei1/Reh1 zinc finger C2H2-type domain-containing protein n=1 Tax=Gnomoniopsis smithogilvyi TaxID=1191159 RepID=A0A9W8YJG4_9PEZI|nr:hypothetical protein N0V93_009988 [Gnomoniopsis smithogilvyi]